MKHIRPYVAPTSDGAFTVRFTAPDTKLHNLRCPTKALADATARKLRLILDAREAGEPMPAEAVSWLEGIRPTWRENFAAWKVLDGARVAALEGIGAHLEAFCAAYAPDKAGRAQYMRATLERFVETTSISKLSQITLTLASEYIRGLLDTHSSHTAQKHQVALKQFCAWAARHGRLRVNPLAEMQGVSARVERERRALTLQEQRELLAHTAASTIDFKQHDREGRLACCISGSERALIYRLALETGLRANEIATLNRGSFKLARVVDGKPAPVVQLRAVDEKNRAGSTLPLRASTAAMIRDHIARKTPNTPAFATPRADCLADMLRADMAAARAAWIEQAGEDAEERQRRSESAFLRDVDDEGLVVDFHALRASFCTNIAVAGVPLASAVKLMRHSDPKLTIGIYSKAGAMQLDLAVEALPDLQLKRSAKKIG